MYTRETITIIKVLSQGTDIPISHKNVSVCLRNLSLLAFLLPAAQIIQCALFGVCLFSFRVTILTVVLNQGQFTLHTPQINLVKSGDICGCHNQADGDANDVR